MWIYYFLWINALWKEKGIMQYEVFPLRRNKKLSCFPMYITWTQIIVATLLKLLNILKYMLGWKTFRKAYYGNYDAIDHCDDGVHFIGLSCLKNRIWQHALHHSDWNQTDTRYSLAWDHTCLKFFQWLEANNLSKI